MAKERSKNQGRKRASKWIYELSPEETIDAIHDLHIQQAEREAVNTSSGRPDEAAGADSDYADLFDITPLGLFLFGEDGIIKKVNRAGAKMLGSDKHSIEGTPFLAFVEGQSAVGFYEQLHEAVSNRERQVLELRIKHLDGGSFPAECDTTPIYDDDGKFVLFRVVIMDTLDRKATKKSMSERQPRK